MKTHLHMSQVAWAMGFVTVFGCTSARADIYTWVDSSGNVNLSNRSPPEGARVTNVYREDPAVHASAEAARAAARAEELRNLNDRVAQLERDLETASVPPPAPVVYAPPMPVPNPYPPVVMQTIVVPNTPTYGEDCNNSWASCFSPGYFGAYPSGVIFLSAPSSHRFHPVHRGQRVPTRPSMPFPKPVGALPEPVNLFPGSHRR